MAVHLITGYKGSEHIQSKDARSFNTAMFGSGEFVMEVGEQLDASIINNNTVRVLDGDILMQGGHIRIETDSFEDMTIQTGTAGTNRIDLIVMTYEKNNSDGTEQAYMEVIKGTESSGTPSVPSYTTGDIAAGDLKNQMPLYKVFVEGVVLSDIESMFTTIPTYKTLSEEAFDEYQAKLEALQGTDILDTLEEIEANTQSGKFAGALGVKEFYQIRSHVGMIVQSTTLDTEDKIKAIYGGTSWTRLDNMFLVGAGTEYAVNSTGGSADAVVPYHTHTISVTGGQHNHVGSYMNMGGSNTTWLNWVGNGTGNYSVIDAIASTGTQLNITGGTSTHSHTASASYAGTSGNEKNANLPPYKAVYIWERTA